MDTIYDLVRFARNLRYEDIPEDALNGAKMLLTDIIATTVAGTTATSSKEVADLMFDWGGKEESSVLVYGKKLPAHHAAFVNSLLSHARDYDEVQSDAIVHTGISVIPTTMATAEAVGGTDGKKILSTIVAADDIFIRMGLAIKASIMESGWIYSPLVGHFASAAAASLIMGLDEETMVNALGIVYSQAAGNQQASADTSLTKRMQPAFAARSGVFSAYLARAGVTGAKNIIDGRYNFYKVYLKDRCDKSILTEDLGKKFWIPTLTYKPYPVCGLILSGAATARKIMLDNNLKVEDITAVEVGVTKQTMDIVVEPKDVKYAPKTVVDAQFSLPFGVANILTKGHLLLSDLTEEGISDPEMLSVIGKIHFHEDPGLEEKYGRGVAPSPVVIHTKDGVYEDCIFQKGHPSNPFTKEDMKEKFMDAMKFSAIPLKSGAAENILSMIDNLEDIKDFSEFIATVNSSFER